MWGTKEYFAPELIDGAYGPQADMWSIGCIMYEMLVGKAAFPFTRNERELYGRIKNKTFDTSCREYVQLSENAKALLNAMLTVDPSRRYSATEALRHNFLVNAEDQSSNHLPDVHENLKEAYNSKTGGRK
jgi:serine/threonine protein kinase